MIIVTGATGTIGRHLVRELSARGLPFRIISRDRAKAAAVAPPGAELAVVDFADAASLRRAFEGGSELFLLTGASPALEAQQSAMIDAARDVGMSGIVRISTFGASADATMRLARMHHALDEKVASAGGGFTILRPAFFMQNLGRQAERIRTQGNFAGAFGDGRIGMIDAADIAAVAAVALTTNRTHGRTLRLTGRELISMRDVASRLSRALGRSVDYLEVDVDAIVDGFVRSGVPDDFAADLGNLQRSIARGGSAIVTDDLADVLGRAPRTFDDFLADEAAAIFGATA